MALGSLRERPAFERLLATRPMARSAHFAVHGLPMPAAALARAGERAQAQELSTDEEQVLSSSVDNFQPKHLLGCVLPKRLVRRSVSRNLLRREIRSAVNERLAVLSPGCWLVRLRAPWAPAQWRSAASMPFRLAVRAELADVLDGCAGQKTLASRARKRRQEP